MNTEYEISINQILATTVKIVLQLYFQFAYFRCLFQVSVTQIETFTDVLRCWMCVIEKKKQNGDKVHSLKGLGGEMKREG